MICGAKVVIISEINNNFAENFDENFKKRRNMTKIVTLGNALTDVLTRIDSDESLNALGLLKGGMTLISAEQFEKLSRALSSLPTKMATGGSAANTALCIAHLTDANGQHRVQSEYIGKINHTDRFGQHFADTFHHAGVHLHAVPSQDEASGVCTAFVSPDGERTMATYLGAAASLQPEDLSLDMFEGAAIVHIEGYLVQNHDLILRAIHLAHKAGALVSLDMASYNIVEADHDFFAEHLLPQTDIVFANEEEAAAWQAGLPEESLASLAQLCNVAVVKVGARGAWAQKGEERVFVAAEKVVNVVDTTAAGDFFAAGFLYAFALGKSQERCLYCGAVCASRVIQVMGTALTDEMWKEVIEMLNKED